MTAALRPVASAADMFRLDPLDRFLALIDGEGFEPALRAEPIVFDIADPVFGYGCAVEGCTLHSTLAGLWCTGHAAQRRAAMRDGVGEAAWKTAAVPLPAKRFRLTDRASRPACRFCPDRDAVAGGLCVRHTASLRRHDTAARFDEAEWAANQRAFPGAGPCRVDGCPRRAELAPGVCPGHRSVWFQAGAPDGVDMQRWLHRVALGSPPGVLDLAGLAPLIAADVRYGLWAHTKATRPARWHPMWLRTLVRSCTAAGVGSLCDLDPNDETWTPQPKAVNRIVRGMRKDIEAVHRSRSDTRELGYIDPNYWGVRFPNRRSVFDLSAISQRWLRDLTWDCLADVLDEPRRPRTAGTFEQIRRAMVCFSVFLTECVPQRGASPATLSDTTARDFVADFTRRVTDGQPVRGVFNVDGSPSPATQISYSLSMNALRRVMRWALDTGAAAAIGLPRDFIVAVPTGGAVSHTNPRPFSDAVLRALSDPANITLLDGMDPHDTGLADMWSIQVRCGRRVSEIVHLRFDCVAEHLGRTWMWVDMTKVGKLDYAVQIPRDVYDLVRVRQAKTVVRFRLKYGTAPSAAQQHDRAVP